MDPSIILKGFLLGKMEEGRAKYGSPTIPTSVAPRKMRDKKVMLIVPQKKERGNSSQT